jgi:integrase
MPISTRRCDRCPPSTGTSKGGVSRTRSPQLLTREPRPRTFLLLGPPLRVARPTKDLQRSVRIAAVRERHDVIGGEILGCATAGTPRLSPDRRPCPLLVSRAVARAGSSSPSFADVVFGHPYLGAPLDASKLSRDYLRPALRKAKIDKPFRCRHDLRHTALTHEAAAGNPQVYVQLKAGHAQGSITERYIHAAQVLFPGAAEKAERRLFAEVSEQPR